MSTELNKRATTKYRKVESYIRRLIDSRVFQPHDKLPSIRQLCSELNLGKNTVIRAYQELEAQGFIYAQDKSGYRVAARRQIAHQAPTPKAVDMLTVSREILEFVPKSERLPLGSAHPSIDAPAIKSLYAEIGRQSRQQSHLASHYQMPPGDALLCQQLAQISENMHVNTTADDIIVTHGAQQAISLALRACTQRGDIVAVESPCYFGNLLLLESLGLKVVEIPSCPMTGLDIEALLTAMTTWDIRALVVTPNFTNPTGARMPLDKRQRLLECTCHIAIIEDDVFGELHFDAPLPTLYQLDTQQRVFYVNSLSKTLDSRLRIGWLLAGRYRQDIEKLMICDHMGSANLMQSATGAFLSKGYYRQHIRRMQRQYHANATLFYRLLCQALDSHPHLLGQYRLHAPQGGFLLWLQLPSHCDSYALYKLCQQQGIHLLPGTLFGTQQQYRHYLRFSVANFDAKQEWQSDISLLAQIIAEHAA